MIEGIREYAWANRKSVSQVAQELMVELNRNHVKHMYGEDPLTAPSSVLTLYIPDRLWNPVMEKMSADGLSMSRSVRIYFEHLLREGPPQ